MSGVTGLADEYWEYFRTSAQLWNIDRGDVEQVAHWEGLSEAGMSRRIERLRAYAERADEFDRAGLDDRERTMLGALSFSAGSSAVSLPNARDLSLVSGPANFATFFSVFVPGYGLAIREHGQGYVDKLRSLPEYATLGRAVFGVDDPVLIRGRLRSDRTLRHADADEITEEAEAVNSTSSAVTPAGASASTSRSSSSTTSCSGRV